MKNKNMTIILLIIFCLVTALQGCTLSKIDNDLESGKYLFSTGSYEESLNYLSRSAENGNTEAQRYVGMIYAYHKEPCDFDKSIYWLEKAASKGDVIAQYQIGFMYWTARIFFGKSRPSDPVKAEYWFNKSASSGFSFAQHQLSLLYDGGEGAVLDKPYLSNRLLESAAKNGDTDAQIDLANAYFSGRTLKREVHLPGDSYFSGRIGIKQDYSQALYWYLQASERNIAEAYYPLGLMYLNGYGTPKQCERAKYYLEKAASAGITDASKLLSKPCENDAAKSAN